MQTPQGTDVLDALNASALQGQELRRFAMELLSHLPDYGWCGVYRLEGEMLVLDEFIGAPTEHTHIPVGRGVCGTAVAEGRNQIVDDVRAIDNYLACSLETRSEIVVLIRREGTLLGQIDIDGHRTGAFGAEDEQFLESVAAILADRWV
jgi:GAF domain-containing protein